MIYWSHPHLSVYQYGAPQPTVPTPLANGNCNSVSPPTPSEGSSVSSNQQSSGGTGASGSGSPNTNGTAPILPTKPAVVYQNTTVTQSNLTPQHNGQRIQRHNGSNNSQRSSQEQLSKTNLYIRGLQASTTDQHLYEMCKQYGKIVSTKAIVDPATNLCKGYGFVDFDRYESAHNAVQQLRQSGIQAQMAKQQEQDPTNLYISNLPRTVTETELETLLSGFGSVISTRILRDNNGVSKGVGFARMESKEKCELIITKFNGKYLHQRNETTAQGAIEPLLCKFADGGPKKTKHHTKFVNGNPRAWREDIQYSAYEVPAMSNGAVANGIMVQPLPGHTGAYPMPNGGSLWVQPPYMMPQQIPSSFPSLDGNVHTITPNMVPQMGQLTAQFNALHLAPPAAAMSVQAQPFTPNQTKQLHKTMYPMPPPAPIVNYRPQQVQQVQTPNGVDSDAGAIVAANSNGVGVVMNNSSVETVSTTSATAEVAQ